MIRWLRSWTQRPVALLAEGVDRNSLCSSSYWSRQVSPSSRRAWIEITLRRMQDRRKEVALLAEGVDRNSIRCLLLSVVSASPSSRRAWIEIEHRRKGQAGILVALLAEGVDRNCMSRTTMAAL